MKFEESKITQVFKLPYLNFFTQVYTHLCFQTFVENIQADVLIHIAPSVL